MWTWLAGDNQLGESGITAGEMIALRAPPRTLDELDDEDGYVPSMAELGRVVALARTQVLTPAISSAVELMVFTAQRRLTVVSARRQDFEPITGGALWRIPSAFMKARRTGRKRRSVHVVPLPTTVWGVVRRAMADSIDPESEWLFPQFRPRRAGGFVGHMSASTLTRALLLMPGIAASPHDLRRGFATHGERRLGWARFHTKSILDHGEGDEGSDVTGLHYALHDGTHHKWGTMEKWAKAVEAEVAPALAADARLGDLLWLKQQVDDRRYQRAARSAFAE